MSNLILAALNILWKLYGPVQILLLMLLLGVYQAWRGSRGRQDV